MSDALRQALRAALGSRYEETASAVLLSPATERELSQVLRLLGEKGGQLGRDAVVLRRRFTEVGPVDERSAVVRVGAGVTLAAVEQAVAPQGFTLGPLSPGARAMELATFLEGPCAGLRAIPGGRLEPLCLALEAVTADGLRYASRPVPRSAAGPGLDALFLGGNGRAGLVFAATLRLFARPVAARSETFSFPDEKAALACLRRSLDDGAWLERARLERRADRVLVELKVLGTPEGVERDLLTVSHRVAGAGGRASAHRVDEPRPAPALEREASWEAVAAAVKGGHGVWLYRLAVESVVAEGQVEGVTLARAEGAAPPGWTEVLAQVDPDRKMGGVL